MAPLLWAAIASPAPAYEDLIVKAHSRALQMLDTRKAVGCTVDEAVTASRPHGGLENMGVLYYHCSRSVQAQQ